MSRELINRLTNEEKVERTACPALDSLYRDTLRRSMQEQATCPRMLHPDASEVTVKKRGEISSPARFYGKQQAPMSGSMI